MKEGKKDKNLEKLEQCTNIHSVGYLHSYVLVLLLYRYHYELSLQILDVTLLHLPFLFIPI